jgi:molybdopterin-guanine dinucleotide biosynthesis protein A
MPMPFSAVVLAGGRSTRMGRDKALLDTPAGPLWRRQRDMVREAGATEIFLSTRPGQAWVARAEGFSAIVEDALSDCGPIVGVTAALERASHRHVAVVAIDLPDMSAGWYHRLLANTADGIGAVGRRGGFFEPLAAVYPVELKWLAWEAIAAGRYSLQPLLAQAVAQGLLRVCEIAPEDRAWFRNWNDGPEGSHSCA